MKSAADKQQLAREVRAKRTAKAIAIDAGNLNAAFVVGWWLFSAADALSKSFSIDELVELADPIEPAAARSNS